MAWLRVETIELLPELRGSLTDLLRRLQPEQWSAPTHCGDWRVGDVANHLVGVELGNVSLRRDRYGFRPGGLEIGAESISTGVGLQPEPGVPLGKWLAAFNQSWVEASQRLSPQVVADLLDVAGKWFEQHVARLDLDALADPVVWAGARAAPVWMDVAREYTERWVHQQHIREALQQPGLVDARHLGAVIATFVHAVPPALAPVPAPEGQTVNVRVTGEGGGDWHVIRWHSDWDLWPGAHGSATAELATTADNAWRLFTRHPRAVAPRLSGDPALAQAAAQAVAVIL